MTHYLIYTFFALAVAVGLYCLWVSLRVEFARVPRFMEASNHAAMHVGGATNLGSEPAHNVR